MAVTNTLKVNTVSINNNLSEFTLSPLQKGFGITIGNALRRTLLSSISGSTIFGVKINDLKHEFTSIPGVKEDATYIILNLKRLVVKINPNLSQAFLSSGKIETWPTLSVNVSGKKVVTGADVVCPAGIEIVNKDAVIANLEEDKAKLVLKIYAGVSTGFINHVQIKDFLRSNDVLALDANFSPIISVSYQVDNKTITQHESVDILKLSVATNGSVSASQAVESAVNQLITLLSALNGTQSSNVNSVSSSENNSDHMDGLDSSIINALKRAGIANIDDLKNTTLTSLKNIPGFHSNYVSKIIDFLADKNITLED